jgi:hypothetical protein
VGVAHEKPPGLLFTQRQAGLVPMAVPQMLMSAANMGRPVGRAQRLLSASVTWPLAGGAKVKDAWEGAPRGVPLMLMPNARPSAYTVQGQGEATWAVRRHPSLLPACLLPLLTGALAPR